MLATDRNIQQYNGLVPMLATDRNIQEYNGLVPMFIWHTRLS